MKLFMLIAIILTAIICLESCGSFSNMTEQEAYDTGYSIGRALRQMSDGRR